MTYRLFICLILLFCYGKGKTQACTTLGQTPQTAFPVCGLDEFKQTTVPYCVNNTIPVPGCGNDYADKNPYWYKFTCYKSGTLIFTITPNKPNEDYDWQIFDVTGRNVNEVYSNPLLFVVANWAGTYAPTGTSASNFQSVECASVPANGVSTYSKPPDLIEGHNYLLMVSHYTSQPNGYSLLFTGGTASITDPNIPALKSAQINCDATIVTVAVTKKVQCSSLAKDGSDFILKNNVANTKAAEGINCNAGFDLDSLRVTLNKPLPVGKYTMYIKNGNDNNTLLDYCNNPVPEGDSVSFEVLPLQPTPFDSIIPPGCAPSTIQLYFKKAIRCNSIEKSGSDFKITGSEPISITSADGNCVGGVSSVINLHLSKPIQKEGVYIVNLSNGSDGNTVIDECGQETLAASRTFTTKDTVSAAFTYRLLYGCTTDTIVCFHDGRNGISQWNWAFTDGYTRTTQNAVVLYNNYGEKQIGLTVSNGICTDSASATVNLDNELIAAFNLSTPFLCPEDKETFTDTSVGNIKSWFWNFANGNTSNFKAPPEQAYPAIGRTNDYNAMLVVQNDHNCFDTAYKPIKVLYNCYIALPTAFTPNGDGKNDCLYPLNAYKAINLDFKVYNRWGQLLFSTKDWTQKWDGSVNGAKQPSGTYVWMLSYTHLDTKQKYFLKGTTVLIR